MPNYCDISGPMAICCATTGLQPSCDGFGKHSFRDGCTWFDSNLNNHCGNPEARCGFTPPQSDLELALDDLIEAIENTDLTVRINDSDEQSCSNCINQPGCVECSSMINHMLTINGVDADEDDFIALADGCQDYEAAEQFDF